MTCAKEHRLPAKRGMWIGVLLVVASASGACGPVTYSRELGVSDEISKVRVSPDSSALVFGIERVWSRSPVNSRGEPALGVARYENIDFELYRYDLAKREGPELVARWKRAGPYDDTWPLFFDGQSVIVAAREGRTLTHWQVDVSTGRRDSIPAPEGAWLQAERRRLDLERPDEQSAYIAFFEESAGQFFQWDPERWEEDLLFELPLDHPPDAIIWRKRQLQERAKFALANSIHLLRSARAASDPDSLRLTFETFVPRPTPRLRAYRVELRIFSWDTPTCPAALPDTLEVARSILPSRGGRFTFAVPWSRIDSTTAPGRVRRKRPSLHLNLIPVHIPADSLLSGYPQEVHMGKEVIVARQ